MCKQTVQAASPFCKTAYLRKLKSLIWKSKFHEDLFELTISSKAIYLSVTEKQLKL